MKSKKLFFILMALQLGACAPAIKERSFGSPKMDFGPDSSDSNLNLSGSGGTPAWTWQGSVSTETYFNVSRDLIHLGQLSGQSGLSAKGTAWLRKFYQSPKMTSTIAFAQTPYTDLVAAQTQGEVQQDITGIEEDLNSARSHLKAEILAFGKKFPFVTSTSQAAITSGKQFTAKLILQIGSMGLSSLIADGVQVQLRQKTASLFQDLQGTINSLAQVTTFSGGLNAVIILTDEYQSSVDVSTRTSLTQALSVSEEIDSMQTSQQALTVLIDLWNMLDANTRVTDFKSANSSLYDFLNQQSATDLACLRKDGCSSGLFQGIEKKLFVLPKIQSYGIAKLQGQLNQACLQSLSAQVGTFLATFIPTLPQTYAQQIDQGLQSETQELQKVKGDYSSYVKGLMSQWAVKVLPASKGEIPGFEVANVQVDFSAGKEGTLKPLSNPLDLSARTAGAAMAVNSSLLQQLPVSDPLNMSLALSQLNKLLAIGGYRDEAQRLVPGLLSAIDAHSQPLDLMNIETTVASYGIPDKIKLVDPFHAAASVPYARNFSAAAFADQIEGLSQMLNYTADWKNTGFEAVLGNIQAQALTSQLQSSALNQPLFPKSLLFALNIADAAVLLEDISKAATPVFLITVGNNIVWADQYSNASDDSAVMAGIVDIENGQKLNKVQVQNEARFLSSIADFLEATDGVEQTQASLLLVKDAQNVSPLDSLVQGRSELKLLVVALANFISNQFMSDQKLVQGNYFLNQLQRSNDPSFLVSDQTAAIRALLRAWEITKIDAYLYSAEDIYFAMNRLMFDSASGFYLNSDHSALSFPEKVETLSTLWELKPHLSASSQAQLVQLTAPLMGALLR